MIPVSIAWLVGALVVAAFAGALVGAGVTHLIAIRTRSRFYEIGRHHGYLDGHSVGYLEGFKTAESASENPWPNSDGSGA